MRLLRVGLAALALSLSACASGGQTHMHAALDHLRAARSELQAAEPNKGGHREKALELTDAAIEQTQKGIEFAREHH